MVWTINCPGVFNDIPQNDRGALTQNTCAVGVISRAEIARLIVESIGSELTFGRIYSDFEAR